MSSPIHLKVFLSSPSDVAAERQAIVRLIKDELPYDPLLRGRVTFDVSAWDDRAQRWRFSPAKAAKPRSTAPWRSLRLDLPSSSCAPASAPRRTTGHRSRTARPGAPALNGSSGMPSTPKSRSSFVAVRPGARSTMVTRRPSVRSLSRQFLPRIFSASILRKIFVTIQARLVGSRDLTPRAHRLELSLAFKPAPSVPTTYPASRRLLRSSSAARARSRRCSPAFARIPFVAVVAAPPAPASHPWSAPASCRACARRRTPPIGAPRRCGRPRGERRPVHRPRRQHWRRCCPNPGRPRAKDLADKLATDDALLPDLCRPHARLPAIRCRVASRDRPIRGTVPPRPSRLRSSACSTMPPACRGCACCSRCVPTSRPGFPLPALRPASPSNFTLAARPPTPWR